MPDRRRLIWQTRDEAIADVSGDIAMSDQINKSDQAGKPDHTDKPAQTHNSNAHTPRTPQSASAWGPSGTSALSVTVEPANQNIAKTASAQKAQPIN
jgi:hypothetical protein